MRVSPLIGDSGESPKLVSMSNSNISLMIGSPVVPNIMTEIINQGGEQLAVLCKAPGQ